MAKPIWSDLQVLNQLTSRDLWGNATITYAFLNNRSQIKEDEGEMSGFSPLNKIQQDIAKLSLAAWNDLITPHLVLGVAGKSDIAFANTTTSIEYAHAYFPDNGTVWLNSNYPNLYKPEFGSYDALTYIHEIGHALGLNHAGDYDGADDEGPSSYQDSAVYTVMSYYGPNEDKGQGQVAWGQWVAADGQQYSPQTPMTNDIMAIQAMYGASVARPDNTVYGFDSTVTDTTYREGKTVLLNVEAATFSDLQDDLNNLTPGVHRFYSNDNNTHFFTANNDEASAVLQAGMLYEGTQFSRSVFSDDNTTEVYRFYNSESNTHFFTANAAEMASLVDGAFSLQYEGVAYLAYDQKTETNTELYRFYNTETNGHFYTSDLAEKEYVAVTLAGQFQYEGVAYYVDMV